MSDKEEVADSITSGPSGSGYLTNLNSYGCSEAQNHSKQNDEKQCSSAKLSIAKRKFDDVDSESRCPEKFAKTDWPTIYDLGDELLLNILQYLDSASIYNFGSLNDRFYTLIKDRSLWLSCEIIVDTAESTNEILTTFLTNQTKSILIDGLKYKKLHGKYKLTKSIMKHLNEHCTNLKKLSLFNIELCFDGKIGLIPSTLNSLTISGCDIDEKRNIFNDSFLALTNLENLCFRKLDWIQTHDLLKFSKLPNLRKLQIRGCPRMNLIVPYAGIASRFGFKKLEIIDLSSSPVSDSDIQCFNVSTTLRELILKSPITRSDPDQSIAEDEDSNDSGSYCFQYSQSGTTDLFNMLNNSSDQVYFIINRNDNGLAEARMVSRSQFIAENGVQSIVENRPNTSLFSRCITDRALCSFGRPRNGVVNGMVYLCGHNRPAESNLERITCRDYISVTDTSLNHLMVCAPRLKYLDVTGTSVSKEGIERFRQSNPDCAIISNFN